MQLLNKQALIGRAQQIRLLILDVDGVLTDGRLYYNEQGEKSKAFYVQDGLGLLFLRSTGVKLAIVSGRSDPCVERRAQDLQFDYYLAGVADKQAALHELLTAESLTSKQCAFVGDDLPDIPILSCVGLAIVVPEAMEYVLQYAHYVTKRSGGHGAVREVVDLIMQAQQTFESVMARYQI